MVGQAISKSEYQHLRDIAWRWDPIGPYPEAREFADDEYDCVIDEALRPIQRGLGTGEVVDEIERFIREHVGIDPPHGAEAFVVELQEWWKTRQPAK